VFAVASRLRRAHLVPGTLTDIEASTLAHLLTRHLRRRYGPGPAPRPAGEQALPAALRSGPGRAAPDECGPGVIEVNGTMTEDDLAGQLTQALGLSSEGADDLG